MKALSRQQHVDRLTGQKLHTTTTLFHNKPSMPNNFPFYVIANDLIVITALEHLVIDINSTSNINIPCQCSY